MADRFVWPALAAACRLSLLGPADPVFREE